MLSEVKVPCYFLSCILFYCMSQFLVPARYHILSLIENLALPFLNKYIYSHLVTSQIQLKIYIFKLAVMILALRRLLSLYVAMYLTPIICWKQSFLALYPVCFWYLVCFHSNCRNGLMVQTGPVSHPKTTVIVLQTEVSLIIVLSEFYLAGASQTIYFSFQSGYKVGFFEKQVGTFSLR